MATDFMIMFCKILLFLTNICDLFIKVDDCLTTHYACLTQTTYLLNITINYVQTINHDYELAVTQWQILMFESRITISIIIVSKLITIIHTN